MGRILVADADDTDRQRLRASLEAHGHAVAEVTDGEAALSRLRAARFHALVCDLNLPRLTGMALLRAVRKELPETEVVTITARTTVAEAVEVMRAGAFDVLEKPVDLEALRLVIGRALERQRLRSVLESQDGTGTPRLGFGSPAMLQIEAVLGKAAPTDATILLTGESGTGKEVAARFVHHYSRRAHGPFVAVNCAALSSQLLESELFGHEKGAFTGASERRRGRIELAEGGTFFLDEIGELDIGLQAKLLRVLQEKTFERVGGHQTIHADVRWLAATNRDLLTEVDAGRFREDLYHRLGVFPVRLPPLSERVDDIVPLARRLLRKLAAAVGRRDLKLTRAAEAALERREYRGNVRELGNVLERAVILTTGDAIDVADLDPFPTPSRAAAPAPEAPPMTLEALERAAIARALAETEGRRKEAAARLGISVRTLYDRIKRHGLG